MNKPKLPAWGYNYAMAQAKRLKLTYPKGLTGADVGRELGLSHRSAIKAMNYFNFYTFDKRYRWEDVAAMLTYRQVKRMAQLDELLGG